MYSQCGELAHIGEGIIRQGADFIVAQISADAKVIFNKYESCIETKSCAIHICTKTELCTQKVLFFPSKTPSLPCKYTF